MARVRNKLTQKELSERSGYNINSISSFENGAIRNINIFIYYFENLLTYEERMEFLKSWHPNSH